MSRRDAVDEYLRRHDPLGLAGGHAAAPTTRRRRPGALPMLAGGGALAVASVALALVLTLTGTPSPGRGPGLLSPQAAVAAAARTLDGDRILHWVVVSDPANQNRADHRKGRISDGRTETWVDLRTLASHSIYPSQKEGGPAVGPEESWYNGQRTFVQQLPKWAMERSDGRKLVVRTVRRRGEKILITRSPIDDVRDTLDLAARGKATLREVAPEGGVPVVRIRQAFVGDGKRGRKGTKAVTMTWITREASPRLLRTVDTIKEPGRPATTSTRTTTTWELLPRTEAALKAVAVPEFDPAKYAVHTRFLGPPKR